MSSFYATFRNKETGEIVKALCWDDYYGRHQYGYKVGMGIPLTEEEMLNKYERVHDTTQG